MTKIFKITALAMAGLCALATSVGAHTVTWGWNAGSNAGDVDFWFGSYHSGSAIPLESQLTLVGVNSTSFGPVTSLFNVTSQTLPTGLSEGSNYFIDPTYTSTFSSVNSWMGVTIGGLNPGDYQFGIQNTGTTTVWWDDWSSNIGNTFTLSGSDIGGGGTSPVPLPASIPLLLGGLGLLGFVGRRKKASS